MSKQRPERETAMEYLNGLTPYERLNVAFVWAKYTEKSVGFTPATAFEGTLVHLQWAVEELAKYVGKEPTAGDEQPETSPWQRAVDGLNALAESGVPFHIEPDGHISNPFGDEHIEWDRAAERWRLVLDDEEVAS